MFISFEGPEGSGKTTQTARLMARLRAAGQPCVLTREPGGTLLGDRVRAILLPESDLAIGARSETLLYCAARAQLVDQLITPALAREEIVVADRYADSTLAYQGYGRCLDLSELTRLLRFATTGVMPDLTFLLDLPSADGLERKRRLPHEEWNRFEQEAIEYHERVRDGFLELAAAEPVRWVMLDARQPTDILEQEIWEHVARRLTSHSP